MDGLGAMMGCVFGESLVVIVHMEPITMKLKVNQWGVVLEGFPQPHVIYTSCRLDGGILETTMGQESIDGWVGPKVRRHSLEF